MTKVPYQIRIDPKQLEKLRKISKDEGEGVNLLIRTGIKMFIKTYEKDTIQRKASTRTIRETT